MGSKDLTAPMAPFGRRALENPLGGNMVQKDFMSFDRGPLVSTVRKLPDLPV